MTRRYWGLIARALVTCTLLAYVATRIDWIQLWFPLAKADLSWLVIACLLFGAAFLFAAMRWSVLLQVQEIAIPLHVPVTLNLIGQFFNVILVGSMGGDVARIVYLARWIPDKKTQVVMSVVMDRVAGSFVLLLLGVAAAAWQHADLVKHDETRTLLYFLIVALGLLVIGLTLLFAASLEHLPDVMRRLWKLMPWNDVVRRAVHVFREYAYQRGQTTKALLFSLVTQLAVISAGYCIAESIHLEASYGQLALVLAVVISVTSLPISIGGHGVREGMFILTFAVLGMRLEDRSSLAGHEIAVLFSILFFALQLAWGLIGGLLYTIVSKATMFGSQSEKLVSRET